MKTNIEEDLRKLLNWYRNIQAKKDFSNESDLLFAFIAFLVAYRAQNFPKHKHIEKLLTQAIIDTTAVMEAAGLFGHDFSRISSIIEPALKYSKTEIISTLFNSLTKIATEEQNELFDLVLILLTENRNRKKDHFYTPSEVCNLFSYIINPHEGNSIADIHPRSGELLRSCTKKLKRGQVYYVDSEALQGFYTKMRLLLQPSLTAEKIEYFYKTNNSETFDFVITNPPFARIPKYGNWQYEFGEEANNFDTLESLYLYWSYKHLNKTGKAAVIVPAGLTFREKKDKDLRKFLTLERSVKSIISLPDNIFSPYTSIATCIVLFDKSKIYDHIRFVDLRNSLNSKTLNEKLYEQINELIDSTEPFDTAVSAPLETIIKNNFDWQFSRYLKKNTTYVHRSPDLIKKDILQKEKELELVKKQIDNLVIDMQRSQQ